MRIATLRWTVRNTSGSSATGRRASTKRRVVLERLEDRIALSGSAQRRLLDQQSVRPELRLDNQGNASIANGEGILNEGTTVQTEFSQSFTIAPGTTTLRFSIDAANLVSNGSASPPDAFEAASLNSQTNQPLVGPPTGLSSTDAFLNIQQTGEVYYAPQVTVPGAGASGAVASLTFPEQISVDVSSVPANTQATLFFDLIGFQPGDQLGANFRRERTARAGAAAGFVHPRPGDRLGGCRRQPHQLRSGQSRRRDRPEPDRVARHRFGRLHRRHDDGRSRRALHVHGRHAGARGQRQSGSRQPMPRAARSPARRSRSTISRRPACS